MMKRTHCEDNSMQKRRAVQKMANFFNSLPPNLQTFVQQKKISSPEEIVTAKRTELLLQGCSVEDIQILKNAAAKIVAQKAIPVSILLKQPFASKWSRLSFGCAALDNCMRGGVPTRGITEICGEPGAGKTQLLLQLSLTVQLPTTLGGFGKGVAYICTEDAFPSKRLFEMAKVFKNRYPSEDINYMSQIYVDHVLENDQLLASVCERLASLMENSNIGLIVIDSVAAVFRLYTNYVERARDLRKLAHCLLHYADKYNCAVVCVNQMASVMGARDALTPCLGLAWAHLGRIRIKVSKVPKQIRIDNVLHMPRKFEIMYSPDTPNDFAEFLITANGVIDVP